MLFLLLIGLVIINIEWLPRRLIFPSAIQEKESDEEEYTGNTTNDTTYNSTHGCLALVRCPGARG